MIQRHHLALRTLGLALGLGILGDGLLRAFPWGLNVTIWLTALVGAALLLKSYHGLPFDGGGRWLLVPIIGFSALFIWRDSAFLQAITVLALLVMLSLAAVRSRSGQIRNAGVIGYVLALLIAGASAAFGFLGLLLSGGTWRALARDPSGSRRSGQGLAIIRGLLIAVPLLCVFGGLFASADAIFADTLERLFDWNIDNLVEHIVVIGFWTWLTAGFLDRMLVGDDWSAGVEAQVRPPAWLGIVELVTVLSLLNGLFLTFVLIQLRYLFGGADVIERSPGLTYAEYARSGFFELVTVAVLVLPLLLLAHWLMRRKSPRDERIFASLAGLLIALLFVVMVSAVQRMRLYQQQFGLTELRFYTTAFMGWLALVFGWFCLTVLRERRQFFVFGALATGLALIVGLYLINPDHLIASTNLARLGAAQPFDADYVSELSADAVPVLLEKLPQLEQADRCRIAQALLNSWGASESPDWRTWNLSRSAAHAAVAARRAYLEQEACPLR